MRMFFKTLTISALICLGLALSPMEGKAAETGEAYEHHKIMQLVKAISELRAVFIRNGSEYSSEEAGNHMKYKLDVAGNRIQTAKEFIDKVASKSYLTGQPYMIRFNDGTTRPSHDWLMEKLYTIESRAGTTSTAGAGA